MFEIRVICDPADTDRVTTALNGAFATGTVRTYSTRDGARTRLYVTAAHRSEPGRWPTPEEAYALAPSIVREIGWTAQAAADKPFGVDLDREYWLRKAALMDRIALEEGDETRSDVATEAARRLIAYDRDGKGDYHRGPYWPEHSATETDPRGYVRQEYAHWAKNH
ncbi:hypothetical protein LRS74_15295 [Streptomyces sp. LX-29]|uniref:hypothetical protein n=1 Tax=Streptomyces sp. LX-29 TaxID=2900152 RepID=UPI00240DDA53|nr:hypothetical protein [Streptomyces sp. LX-29]WFB08266.1 hypothetical protein LRS74_15295 [Streptomyces sp. LX-29]